MQQPTKNVLAAAVAGVVIGAFVTAVLMSNDTSRRDDAPEPRVERQAPGTDPDDVVAVLDADRPAASQSARAMTPTAAPGGAPPGPEPIDPSVPVLSAGTGDLVELLRGRRLAIPVQGYAAERLVPSFDDQRSGARRHEAIDILAPRHTPVVAVEDGTIARLFSSKAGGITLYQYDPRERFVYYYAHLDRYADGVKEGDPLRRGQVIGYVGTTGNAPPNTPHLHFAIYEMRERKRWWEGTPIDPYLVLR